MVKAETSGKGEILHCTLTKSLFGFPIFVSKFSKFSISSVKYVYTPKHESTYSEPAKCEYQFKFVVVRTFGTVHLLTGQSLS